MPIPSNSPSSAPWRRAGGTRTGPGSRCTISTRCASSTCSAPSRWRGAGSLDVGCGGGILSESMARQGRKCWESICRKRCSKSRSCTRSRREVSVDYRAVSAEDLAARAPGRLRCGDLHGDARARARSCRNAARSRGLVEAAGRRCRIDPQSQSDRILRGRHRGRGVHCPGPAARNTRVPEIHPAVRARALGTLGGPRASGSDRHLL